MKQKNSFTRLIQVWGLIFLIGTGASIMTLDVIGLYRECRFRAEQMRTDYIDGRKALIKQEVLRAVDMIDHEKTQSTALIRTQIKTRVYEACAIAENIYQRNKSIRTAAEIQQIILDALSPIRFDNGSGSYFVIRLDGRVMLFADSPEMTEGNFWDVRDMRGQSICKDMTQIVTQSGEGFYEYLWTKPDDTGDAFEKIAFVKKIEPYDWYIGATLSVEDIEAQIKASLLSAISRIRFGREGYIFVHRLNGDVLVSNGRLFSGKQKLWEVFNKNPEKIKGIFHELHRAALKPDGDYIYYSHFKLTTHDNEWPKASFVYGIPDLQWLVGAGVYLDNVEADIAVLQAEFTNRIKNKILCFILIAGSIVALFLFLFSRLSRKLKNDFDLFSSFFHRAAFSYESIDRKQVQFDELERMAENANKMLWERKQAEDELRRLRNYLSNIIDSMPSVIVGVDPDGRVTQWNNEACRITGISSHEAMDQPLEKAFPRLAGKMERMREAIRIREPQIDFRQVRKEAGEIRYEDVSVYPLVANCVEGAVIRVDDVTEQVRIEEMMVQSEKMLSVGGLAAGMAHEINNPLAGMMQTAEVIVNRLTRNDLPANVRAAQETGITMSAVQAFMEKRRIIDMLGHIRESGSRAAEIVSNMLFFARKSDASWSSYNIADLLDQIVDLAGADYDLKKKYDFRRIRIVREYENDLPLVPCESAKIQQVLLNILRNGAEAMQENSINGRRKPPCFVLRLTYECDAGMVRIEIEDNGSGMDEKTRRRVFEPFFTTKPTGRGTGIGLSISYFIITENHNGTLSVESSPGEGAKFIIRLPVEKNRHEPMKKDAARELSGV